MANKDFQNGLIVGLAAGSTQVESGRLPTEYQQVEYIESTGTQYIDTGLTATNYDTYLISGIFTNTTGTQCMLAYTLDNTAKYASGWFGIVSNNFNFSPIGVQTWTPMGNADISIHNFKWSYLNKNAFVDDNRSYLNYSGIKNNIATHYLFARHNTDGTDVVDYFCNFKMSNARFYDDNLELVADFIPCYRKADNEIGMYDIVRNQFFTNQGTGTFLKGADI